MKAPEKETKPRTQLEASIVVMDGEMAVFWPMPVAQSYDSQSPKRRLLENKRNMSSGALPDSYCGPYSVHGGEFRFYYRKQVGDLDNGVTLQPDGDISDDEEPRFRGGYIVDEEFRTRCALTRVVL